VDRPFDLTAAGVLPVPRSLPSSAAAALAAALLLPVVAVSGQETERHLLTGDRIEIWNLAGATTISRTSESACL
jgi:hypothetical protein